ncbi:MAG: DUF2721 domain-containing protein [Opitutaceae bacterium]
MELTLTTPSILFPAVSLLLLAYTNRYLAIAGIIRALHARYQQDSSSVVRRQIDNLSLRLKWIRSMQAYGVVSLIVCISSIVAIFFEFHVVGAVFFGLSLVLMLISLVYCLLEVLFSGRALAIELEDMKCD